MAEREIIGEVPICDTYRGLTNAVLFVYADGGVEIDVRGANKIVLAEPRNFPERSNWFDEWCAPEPAWRFDPFRYAPAYSRNNVEVPVLCPTVEDSDG
jgi:hypothetical protein